MRRSNIFYYLFHPAFLLILASTASSQTPVNFQIAQPPLLVADYSFKGNQDGVNFSFWDSSSTTITSWFWDFDDGNTSTDQNPQHTFSSVGVYNVCLSVINTNGCSDTTCREVNSFTVDVAEHLSNESYLVYPNPFNSSLSVVLPLKSATTVNIALYNVVGERAAILYSGVLEDGMNKMTFSNPVADLKPGVYFMKINADQTVYTEKIIKNL